MLNISSNRKLLELPAPERELSVVSFDFDGTLVDSVTHKLRQNMALAALFGNTISLEESKRRWSAASGFDDLMRRLIAPSQDIERAMRFIRETYDDPEYAKRHFADVDANSVIRHLGAKGYKRSIITNLSRELLDRDMRSLTIGSDAFDFTQTAEECPYTKPDPRVFGRLLKYFGVTPGQVVHLGDEMADLHAADGAGIHFIGIENGMAEPDQFEASGALHVPTVESAAHIIERPLFRELEPSPFWSGIIHVGMPYDEFRSQAEQFARQTPRGFSGFMTQRVDGWVDTFTMTLYPRKKYGTPTLEECIQTADSFATQLGKSLNSEDFNAIRIVMGLCRGYSSQPIENGYSTIVSTLQNASVSPASIFSARFRDDGSVSAYEEPVAVIQASDADKMTVYNLAEYLQQERFSVEDPQNNATYLVETRHCTEPDGEKTTRSLHGVPLTVAA